MECKLIDGVQCNKEHPKTFHIPFDHEKSSIKSGDFVKIGLESAEIGGERFWAIISEIREENGVVTYTGIVDNDLVKFGELYPAWSNIVFRPEHILAILRT